MNAETLWFVNNEYRKRLSKTQTALSLVAQMLLEDEYSGNIVVALHYIIGEIEALTEEHRVWRNNFYYESVESKRMVQSGREIMRALSQFSRMRSEHDSRLQYLYLLLEGLERPEPHLTQVYNGDDLWDKALLAMYELGMFGEYVQSLNA